MIELVGNTNILYNSLIINPPSALDVSSLDNFVYDSVTTDADALDYLEEEDYGDYILEVSDEAYNLALTEQLLPRVHWLDS